MGMAQSFWPQLMDYHGLTLRTLEHPPCSLKALTHSCRPIHEFILQQYKQPEQSSKKPCPFGIDDLKYTTNLSHPCDFGNHPQTSAPNPSVNHHSSPRHLGFLATLHVTVGLMKGQTLLPLPPREATGSQALWTQRDTMMGGKWWKCVEFLE